VQLQRPGTKAVVFVPALATRSVLDSMLMGAVSMPVRTRSSGNEMSSLYVHRTVKWDASGVAIYFFPRGSEPADITAGVPQPDTWGAAQARWPSTSCDAFKFFNNHHAIFDTTLW
jgi:hypothetical protein